MVIISLLLSLSLSPPPYLQYKGSVSYCYLFVYECPVLGLSDPPPSPFGLVVGIAAFLLLLLDLGRGRDDVLIVRRLDQSSLESVNFVNKLGRSPYRNLVPLLSQVDLVVGHIY